jgi:cytoskeletal protein CcmA (bactofilin family)
MFNPFKFRGFSTLIGKGVVIENADIFIPDKSTFVVEGAVKTSRVCSNGEVSVIADGVLEVAGDLSVHNVQVNGNLYCKTLRVDGVLSVRSGCYLRAEKILYRSLDIQEGARIEGHLYHIDHSSAGETV